MSLKDEDLKKFAKLRGFEEGSGWVKWGEIFALSLFLAGFILLVTDKFSHAADNIITPAPYTGMIKNHTRLTLAVPSQNSDAALLIPPGDWIEYTVWKPEFSVTAYVDGDPYDCRQVQVAPRSFKHLCTDYDFVAEFTAKGLPDYPQKKRFKKRLKGGMEVLG